MADWLSRHAEGSAELFLANALPGGERTVSDRLDQLLVGPIDQRRLGIERLHPARSVLNSEFHSADPIGTSKGFVAACARIALGIAATESHHAQRPESPCCNGRHRASARSVRSCLAERPLTALCSRWLTTRRMGEDVRYY